jgi:hypothetical protein
MTCIVGLLDTNGDIYAGGDSAGVGGLSLTIRKDPKVFINGDFIIGFTSSFRMGQLLHYSWKPPKQNKKDIKTFIYTDVINSIRKCFKDGGYLQKDREAEQGGRFLIGYKGHLFEVDSDFQIGYFHDNFHAVGCGSDIALGSLYSTKLDAHPIIRIETALKAAEHFSAGVRGPFTIINLENK